MAAMKMTITRAQALQLEALVLLGRKHHAVMQECEQEICAMLGPESTDFAGDVLYDDARPLAWMLERLGVEVVADNAKTGAAQPAEISAN